MKIVATDVEGILPPIVLGDDEGAEDWIYDPPPLPIEDRAVQITRLFRGANPFTWGRANRQTSFSWQVARQHASIDAAGAFYRWHASGVPINVSLAVQDGANMDTYIGSIPQVAAVERVGRSTAFKYTIVGAVLQAASTDGGNAAQANPPPTDQS